ncbi:MAG TPA: phosphomannose isomerase type II C-terminal cupin domain [Blastocatellia bacterium]|nr:phosphomannose isomerase type II C-terminal cupin domain [Blastocatellia bacterium]
MRGEFDQRPWGSYEVLEDLDGFKVKKIIVNPGHRLSLQSHKRRSEHWVITSGEALVTLNDGQHRLAPNQYIHVPSGARHRVENPGSEPLVFIEVQCGDYLGEDDIVRYQDDYQRS